MGYLCKYLKANGWQTDVVSEKIEGNSCAHLVGYANTTTIKFYKHKSGILKKFEWLTINLLDWIFKYKDKKMIKYCRPLIKKNKYKIILCSSYRTFPLLTANYLSKRYKIPLIIDLRDIVEQYVTHGYITHEIKACPPIKNLIIKIIRKRLIKNRNTAIKNAKCITTISTWHQQTLKKYNQNVRLIYNGFDPEVFYPEHITSKQFTIVYTGRLHSLQSRNPELLFEAINQLNKEKQISAANTRIAWYTDLKSRLIIQAEAQRFDLEQFMDYYDYVPGNQLRDIFNKSSIMLLLTNRTGTSGPYGIMTTKFFEYLAVEKPILCVRSDESLLAQAINETNAGIAATSVEQVCKFIMECYKQWENIGFTSIKINKEKIGLFSRQEQAKQYIKIFNEFAKS